MTVATKISPFLMFEGQAEQAMAFYTSLFPSSEITEIVRYGAAGPGPEGSLMKAVFFLAGQRVQCTDSPIKHRFTFTPSFSFFVDCESEAEIQRLASALAEGGGVLMPLNNYGFSRQFAWVSDRFGVSWQVNLE